MDRQMNMLKSRAEELDINTFSLNLPQTFKTLLMGTNILNNKFTPKRNFDRIHSVNTLKVNYPSGYLVG